MRAQQMCGTPVSVGRMLVLAIFHKGIFYQGNIFFCLTDQRTMIHNYRSFGVSSKLEVGLLDSSG